MTVQVGIVGAGNMGATHARNLLADKRVEIIGIADVVAPKAEALACTFLNFRSDRLNRERVVPAAGSSSAGAPKATAQDTSSHSLQSPW